MKKSVSFSYIILLNVKIDKLKNLQCEVEMINLLLIIDTVYIMFMSFSIAHIKL